MAKQRALTKVRRERERCDAAKQRFEDAMRAARPVASLREIAAEAGMTHESVRKIVG